MVKPFTWRIRSNAFEPDRSTDAFRTLLVCSGNHRSHPGNHGKPPVFTGAMPSTFIVGQSACAGALDSCRSVSQHQGLFKLIYNDLRSSAVRQKVRSFRSGRRGGRCATGTHRGGSPSIVLHPFSSGRRVASLGPSASHTATVSRRCIPFAPSAPRGAGAVPYRQGGTCSQEPDTSSVVLGMLGKNWRYRD